METRRISKAKLKSIQQPLINYIKITRHTGCTLDYWASDYEDLLTVETSKHWLFVYRTNIVDATVVSVNWYRLPIAIVPRENIISVAIDYVEAIYED